MKIHVVIIVCLCLVSFNIQARPPLRRPPVPPSEWGTVPFDWKIITKADVIARGVVKFDSESMKNAGEKGSGYINLSIIPSEYIKGNFEKGVDIVLFAKTDLRGAPSPDLVRSYEGQDCLILADRVSDEYSDRYYIFSSLPPLGIRSFNSSDFNFIKSEVKKSDEWLANFDTYRQNFINDPMDKKVAKLISKLDHPKETNGTIKKLWKLGTKAVPTMIRHMDDLRSFKSREISLRVFGDSYERYSTKEFRKVAEAIEFLVQRITKENFGGMETVHSDEEILRSVNEWRIYLMRYSDGVIPGNTS